MSIIFSIPAVCGADDDRHAASPAAQHVKLLFRVQRPAGSGIAIAIPCGAENAARSSTV
jgi:hypothetical protein